jgi:hypothetical protein
MVYVKGILVPLDTRFGFTFKQISTVSPSKILVPGVTVKLKYDSCVFDVSLTVTGLEVATTGPEVEPVKISMMIVSEPSVVRSSLRVLVIAPKLLVISNEPLI